MSSLPPDTEPISLGSFSWSFVLYIVKLQRRFRQMRERRELKRIAAMEAERAATANELRAKQVQRRQSISGGGAFVPPHRRASSVSFAGISASQLATLQSMPDLESPTRVAAPAWAQALFSSASPPAPQPLALAIDGDDAAFKFSWGFLRIIVRLQRRFRAMRARTEATRLALMQKEKCDTAEDLRRRIQARKAAAAADAAGTGAADCVGGALAAHGGAPSVRTSFAHRRTQSASAALSFFSTPQ